MSVEGIFQLITNDGIQDNMMFATELLNKRLPNQNMYELSQIVNPEHLYDVIYDIYPECSKAKLSEYKNEYVLSFETNISKYKITSSNISSNREPNKFLDYYNNYRKTKIDPIIDIIFDKISLPLPTEICNIIKQMCKNNNHISATRVYNNISGTGIINANQ